MATKEELLRTKTFKGDNEEIPLRVFYTLQSDKSLQTHRNSKAIAILVGHLRARDLITDEQIDELLLEVVG